MRAHGGERIWRRWHIVGRTVSGREETVVVRLTLILIANNVPEGDDLAQILRASGVFVSRTDDLEGGMRLASALLPDLMFVAAEDYRAGIEYCRQLRSKPLMEKIPLILALVCGRSDDRAKCEAAGADDVILWPVTESDLFARVTKVLRRTPSLNFDSVISIGDFEMDVVAHKVRRAGKAVALSPTEFRLLRHFLTHPRWVIPREILLDSVGRKVESITVRAIDVHVRRLRKAINAGGGPDVIRTVRSIGYALDVGD